MDSDTHVAGRHDATTPVVQTMTSRVHRRCRGAHPTGHPGVFDKVEAFNKPLVGFFDAQPR